MTLTGIVTLFLGSCAMHHQWDEAAPEVVKQQDLKDYPYHPLIYHLDLSILAYQLYGQTLVWPFDPYYEELDDGKDGRRLHMERVRNWAASQATKQADQPTSLAHYRGPGLLNGFPDNPRHDPIIFRYDRLHPWNDTLTNASGRWTEYLTPKEITERIEKIYVCMRKNGGSEDQVILRRLPGRGKRQHQSARDVLFGFEGGTGDKGEEGQPASQSLMGFVLLRHLPSGKGYDLHISFRGSRSGSAGRSALQAIRTEDARGNPDWITDLGFRHLSPSEGSQHISTTGKVCRGFARSVSSMLPSVFRCLREVDALQSGTPPRHITVTGHSLGGALAQHFTSAILMGNRYGPDGNGPAMPTGLRDWPWQQIKLDTYGAPRAGNYKWAETLSEHGLKARPFDALMDPYDRNALPVAHPSIIPRLTDSTNPAGFRVLFSMDPITTKGMVGGDHVGRSIYVNEPRLLDGFLLWSFDAHEPSLTRDSMLNSLGDSNIPPTAWRYRQMAELNPDRNDDLRGRLSEYQKIHQAIKTYHQQHGLYYNKLAHQREFDHFQSTLAQP